MFICIDLQLNIGPCRNLRIPSSEVRGARVAHINNVKENHTNIALPLNAPPSAFIFIFSSEFLFRLHKQRASGINHASVAHLLSLPESIPAKQFADLSLVIVICVV